MAFRDSGDDGGKKKSKRPEKSGNSRNGRGSLVLVLVVLWLLGLTAAVAFFNLTGGPGGTGDMETRLARLEQRAGQVRGAVPPPGADGLGVLTDRVNALEARLADAGNGAGNGGSSAGAGIAPVAMDGDCPCDLILSRLDRLENRMTVAAAGTSAPAEAKKAEADRDATEKKAEASESRPEKAAAPAARTTRKSVRPGTRKPEPPRDIPGVAVRAFRRDGRPRDPVMAPTVAPRGTPAPSAPVYSPAPAYSRDGAFSEDIRRNNQSESVYDITRRMAPMYGYTEDESRRMERLAPGAAIYPGDNGGGYTGSVLAN